MFFPGRVKLLQDKHRKGKHCIPSSLPNAQLGSEEALAVVRPSVLRRSPIGRNGRFRQRFHHITFALFGPLGTG
jgi:hypothetical protein